MMRSHSASAAAPPADRLRHLARLIERLGVGGRTDPEQIVLAKLSVGRELRLLARELEHPVRRHGT